MNRKVSIAEQIEELESEWERRHKEYPVLVAQGRMRRYRMELRLERLQATINLLAWLDENADAVREYMLYATRICPPAQGGEWNEQCKDGLDMTNTDSSSTPAGSADETRPSGSTSN